MTAPPTGSAPGRTLRIAGVILIVLGVVLGAVAVAVGVSRVVGLDVEPVTGTVGIDAEAGDELALYRVGGFGEGSCTVVGPDDVPVDQRQPFGTETLTLDGVEYRVHRVLTVRTGGEQLVTCAGSGFAVGPRVGVFGLVGLILGGVFGGLALVAIGVILLVVGFSRRKRSRGSPLQGGQWPGGPSYPGQPSGSGPAGYGPAGYGQPPAPGWSPSGPGTGQPGAAPPGPPGPTWPPQGPTWPPQGSPGG